MKIVILGAGPTGLGAAHRLHSLGHAQWELWEATTEPGGLARSVTDRHGFTWDIGGHVQFSHYKEFDALMDAALGPDGWLEHVRESWVRILGTWVPYPFQNNIHRLPPEQRERCLQGLLAVTGTPPDRRFENFEALIRGCFGEGLAELFMIPYNEKVWAWPPRELGTGWIGDRVALPDLERIRETVRLHRDDVAWGPNSTFRFPKCGGTGAVWRAVATMLPAEKLHFERAAAAIDPERRTVTAADGTETHYDALLTSLPLNVLVELAGLESLRAAAGLLRWSTVHIVGVGLHGSAGPALESKCWMYFPEDNCPFYRVTHFSHYSPNNVPDIGRAWSLMAEVSASPHRSVDASRVEADVVEGLINTGLIESREQVHHTWAITVEQGYPTPALRRDEALGELLPALDAMGIYSRGRFGAWKYEVSNQDHSMMQGVEAVDRLLNGSPEKTVWFPEVVNKRRPRSKI